MKSILLVIWALATVASAELSLPTVFGDHMVLQADKPVSVWGKADPAAAIEVRYAGQVAKAKADASGKWKVALKPMKADAKGGDLVVSNGSRTLAFKDVLVGEVWFASGQSNMQWALRQIGDDGVKAAAAADVPGIRFYQVKLTTAASPQDDVAGGWTVSSPQTAPAYSAVAWYFAHKLHRELGVPVGIVQSAWGGKPVETFTSRQALMAIAEGKPLMESHDAAVAAYDEAAQKAKYEVALQTYQKQKKAWDALPKQQRKGRGPRKPGFPGSPALVAGRPATIWNGMIHPLAGYSQRGAIWYQGESNARTLEGAQAYGSLFSAMIEDWRRHWGDDFRFLWVQLADFREPVKEAGTNQPWAVVQDQQRRCLALDKTGMAVINDIGHPNNIHPPNKKDVGERLARWALADDYGRAVVKCGPLYRSHRISGSSVVVEFDHAGKGLGSRDGEALKRFEILDDKGQWHWAEAVVKGDSVVVSSAKVSKPSAARYAWASNPEGANLVNSEGLPASCFTTE